MQNFMKEGQRLKGEVRRISKKRCAENTKVVRNEKKKKEKNFQQRVRKEGESQAGVPPFGRRARIPTAALHPSPPLPLYFYSARMQNNLLKTCVMYLPDNRSNTQTQTAARTQCINRLSSLS